MQITNNAPLGAQPQAKAKAELQQAATAFEAIFMRQMIGAMRSASLAEGLTDSGVTEQFRDMADARTADSMAESGGFGIAQLLMRQLGPTVAPAPAAETDGAR